MYQLGFRAGQLRVIGFAAIVLGEADPGPSLRAITLGSLDYVSGLPQPAEIEAARGLTVPNAVTVHDLACRRIRHQAWVLPLDCEVAWFQWLGYLLQVMPLDTSNEPEWLPLVLRSLDTSPDLRSKLRERRAARGW